jgi:hypothetical protein
MNLTEASAWLIVILAIVLGIVILYAIAHRNDGNS